MEKKGWFGQTVLDAGGLREGATSGEYILTAS